MSQDQSVSESLQSGWPFSSSLRLALLAQVSPRMQKLLLVPMPLRSQQRRSHSARSVRQDHLRARLPASPRQTGRD